MQFRGKVSYIDIDGLLSSVKKIMIRNILYAHTGNFSWQMKAYQKNMQEKPKENEEAQYADTEVKAGLMKTIEGLLASSAINSTLPPAKAREQALIDLLQRVYVWC